MLKSFGSRSTEDIYHGLNSRDARKIPQSVWKVAARKLDMMNSAVKLEDLKIPPGNRLESLKGDLKGRWSIRINDQYRIIFTFKEGHVFDAEIADYH